MLILLYYCFIYDIIYVIYDFLEWKSSGGSIMKKDRNYGIDLLRLVLMFMVCILHVLGRGGILGVSIKGSVSYGVFWFLEVFSYCAVDAFALISGYTAVNKPRKYDRLVNMWFQVLFYSFVVTGIFAIVGVYKDFNLTEIIKSIMPITFGRFWYMSAYFALFLAIPILNNFIFNVDESTAKKSLFIMFLLFSVIGVIGDPFVSLNGYSAIWLIVLYCMGGLAKRIDLFKNKSVLTLVLLWGICIISTWLIYVFLGKDLLLNYISPTILLSGLVMVILFSRIKLNGKIISKLSPYVLGIYLFQLSPVMWDIFINDSFTFVVNNNLFVGILLVFALASIIFISGLIVETARSKFSELIKLPVLSKKIVLGAEHMLNKLFIILK